MLKSILRAIGQLWWLRLGLRRRIVGLFYPAISGAAASFAVPYHGIEYRGDIVVAQEWHVYFFGGYELKEAALIGDLLRELPKPVVFDIGANLGGHTFVMAEHAVEVHAFEPYAPLADKIAEQAARCGLQHIHLYYFGLGNENSQLSYFFDKESNNSGTGSFKAEHTGAASVGYLEVRRGDDLELPVPSFVKIDIEGFEAYALKGLANTLNAAQPVIMMEVTESSWETFEICGGLEAVLRYPVEIYEICNARYVLGLFQTRRYRLQHLTQVEPRQASFNVLLVPQKRMSLLTCLTG